MHFIIHAKKNSRVKLKRHIKKLQVNIHPTVSQLMQLKVKAQQAYTAA
jgi:hypothetical protein